MNACRTSGLEGLPNAGGESVSNGQLEKIPSRKELIAFAQWAASKQPEAVEIIRKHGFIFDNLDDKWQKLAFSFYSDLSEINWGVKAMYDKVDMIDQEGGP